jgi:hypothetical protein
MSMLERLKKALGLSTEEDPLKREVEEMRKLARGAASEARIERRKPRKEKAFEGALPEELFPEELVEKKE